MNKNLSPIQLILIGVGLMILNSLFQGSAYIVRGFGVAISIAAIISIVVGIIGLFTGGGNSKMPSEQEKPKKKLKKYYDDNDDF